MTQQLECNLGVGKSQVTNTAEGTQKVTTTLSGLAHVDTNQDGMIMRDEIEVQVTIKSGMVATPKYLGLELGLSKKMTFGEINRSLEDYGDEDD